MTKKINGGKMSIRRMPHKNVIKREWENKFRFIEDFGWKELPTDACWRCGKEGYVERCHINSRFHTQDDSPSNLHLLCGGCHKESENLYGWGVNQAYYLWFYSINLQDFIMHKLIPGLNVKFYEGMSTEEMEKEVEKKIIPWYDKGLDTGKTILEIR
tara:strand:- start:2075 stop:2545 length:471 start_codon:yes stop_codon:yes gene_type:complete